MCPLKKNEDYESEKQEVKRDYGYHSQTLLLSKATIKVVETDQKTGGLPKHRGTFGGVPNSKDYSIWGLYWDPPIYGNSQPNIPLL